MEIFSEAEYTRKKPKAIPENSAPKESESKNAEISISEGRPDLQKQKPPSDLFIPKRRFILQDPDLKSFKDQIKINGLLFDRECVEGVMKTNSKELSDFMVGKGYFLIDIVEE